jgi:hypothetical protein
LIFYFTPSQLTGKCKNDFNSAPSDPMRVILTQEASFLLDIGADFFDVLGVHAGGESSHLTCCGLG